MVAPMRTSLEGLALGDAFGERFFLPPGLAEHLIEQRALPARPQWPWTDDTAMALVLVAHLERRGAAGVDPDALAHEFLVAYATEPERGYGGGMHRLFGELAVGRSHRDATHSLFGGEGSFGNGAAMRVAPLGACYAELGLERVAREAVLQAEVTHAHPEGVAGAVAVAIATAVATRQRGEPAAVASAALRSAVLAHTPESEVRRRVAQAAALAPDASVQLAAPVLGNGERISAQDTVPFCVWSAWRWLEAGFEEAMWQTVAALGDRDTTCAIVGGIIAPFHGLDALPADWLARREPIAR